MGELAEVLMVQAPHVTREVRRLRDQGLVTPRPNQATTRPACRGPDGLSSLVVVMLARLRSVVRC
jgi:DNA-binding transcriptional ArsR family regulator